MQYQSIDLLLHLYT